MYIRDIVISNKVGLHAGPASLFTQKANEFKSTILLERGNRSVNAKSLLGVLSMGIMKDMQISIIGDGEDEVEAVDTLCSLVESGFVRE